MQKYVLVHTVFEKGNEATKNNFIIHLYFNTYILQ